MLRLLVDVIKPCGHCTHIIDNLRASDNMKFLLICAALVAVAVSGAPPSWRPSGRVLLLPTHLEDRPELEDNVNAPQDSKGGSPPQRILDSGEYYVLLDDGRLQMVKYTTSTLQNTNQQQQDFQQFHQQQTSYQNQNSQYQNSFLDSSSNFNQFQQHSQQVKLEPSASLKPFQIEYVQFPLLGSEYTQTKLQFKAESEAKPQEVKVNSEGQKEESGFEAEVEYRNVKPISAPIFAHNPSPLVRILKK